MPRRPRRQKPFQFFLNSKGIDEEQGIFRITPAEADLIQNMHRGKTGEFTTLNQGYGFLTAALESGARIDGMYHYREADGTNHFLTNINGKILDIDPDDGSNDATVSTSNTAGEIVGFTTFKGSAYIVSPTMTPETWAGTGSASAVSGIPLTNGSETYEYPQVVATYSNRMVYGNFKGATDYPSHLVISDDLAPDTFTLGTNPTDGAVMQVNPGDSQEITAIKTKHVPNQSDTFLFIFKNRSLWALSGNTPDTTSTKLFTLTSINSNWGCLNQNCVVEVGADLFFIDENDIYSLSTAAESGSLQPKIIGSNKVRETLADMNLSQSAKAWATHLPFRQEIWFAIPTGSASEADTILVYNYRNREQGEDAWTVRTGMDATIGIQYNGRLYAGTTVGKVAKWFAQSDYAGTAFTWKYRYPFYDFQQRMQYKRITKLFAHYRVRTTETITIKTTWRIGGNDTTKTITKTVTGAGAVYGTGVYGTDVYATSDKIAVVPVPVLGNGALFQFETSASTGNTGVDFLGISGVVEFGDFIDRYN